MMGEPFADDDDVVEPVRSSAGSLPGFAELLAANLRGELSALGPGMIIDDKWELLDSLGEGSFGKVYEARHVKLGHRAAIKVLAGKRAGPQDKQRFLEEAQLMAGMSSQHLIRASDYGELPDGSPYFVMDLVKGKSLRYSLEAPLPLDSVLHIGEQLLTGLAEVHRLGVVHGDIKPENVVISDEGRARLLDFGLARTSLGESDVLSGTPQYMAPEMILDRAPPSVHTDVYAVAVVLYEMLTGRLPRGHVGMDVASMRAEWSIRPRADRSLMHCNRVPAAQREVLERFDELVMDALATDPAARPRSAQQMLEELSGLRKQLLPESNASVHVPATRPARQASNQASSTAHVPRNARLGRKYLVSGLLVAICTLAASLVAWWRWSDESDTRPGAPAPVEPVEARAVASPIPPPDMVYVAGGSFRRGTVDVEDHFDDCRNAYDDACAWRTFDREAQHAGTVDVPSFFLDEYEVTNAQLLAFMIELQARGEARIVPELGLKTVGVRPERALVSFELSSDPRFEEQPYRAFQGDARALEPAAGMANRPAVLLTWDLAARYCRSKGKRLPTETEWEYAARGPESKDYVWGEAAINCRDAAYGRHTLVVDDAYIECRNEEKRPNEIGTSKLDRSWCGAADMGVNVSEWVADAFVDPNIGCPPPGGSSGSNDRAEASLCHVYKGGNWIEPWRFSRAAYRPVAQPSFRYVTIGFRCAASVEET